MSKNPYPSETADRYIVRFPDGMRDRLKKLAADSGRSLNSEIIERLEQTLRSGPTEESLVTMIQNYERLAAKMLVLQCTISRLARESGLDDYAIMLEEEKRLEQSLGRNLQEPDWPKIDPPPSGGGSSASDKAIPARFRQEKLHHRGK